MSDKQSSHRIRDWYKMSDRERAVWCASYATQLDKDASALSKALTADQVVTQLRTLNVDSYPYEPEHELWRVGLNLKYEEFAPWYRIALRMTRVGRAGVDAYERVTDQECKDAYHRYELSAGDFS